MKLTLHDLGRIDQAELDLRPLTVLIGKNNTNKSWAVYAAYATLDCQSFAGLASGDVVAVVGDWQLPHHRAILEATHALDDGETVTHEVRAERRPERAGGRCEGLALSQYTGAPSEAARAVLELEPDDSPMVFDRVVVTVTRQGELFALSAQCSGPQTGRLSATVPRDALPDKLALYLSALTVHTRRAYVFPTERALLIQDVLTAPDLFTMPVHDCDAWLREARQRHQTGQRFGGDPELVALLGRAVGGAYAVDHAGSVRFVGEDFSVPLPSAASMARSLAGLSLYLDTLAHPGDVLVIDEPEMNAHPEAQLALVELFAIMVNRGIRVWFTTHSPYMVEHLDSIMEGSRLDPGAQERAARAFQLGTPELFLSPDKVAAYEFVEVDDGKRVEVRDVLSRDDAQIETTTFGRVTQRMGELMNRVLDEQ